MNSADFSIQWRDCNLTNLDFADNTELLTAKTKAMQHMTDNLQDVGEKVRLREQCAQSTEILKISQPDNVDILINKQLIKEVDHFQYLGIFMLNDGGTERDLASHLVQAVSVFYDLQLVWSAAPLSRTTKLCLCIAMVLSMDICASEVWKSRASMAHKLNVFNQKCL